MVASYAFTFGDIETICKRLGVYQANKGSKTWRGIGPDGVFRQTYNHSHGGGDLIATGTAKQTVQQLLFEDLKDMHDFLNDKKRKV